jgi:parallel beta-helix repeat protein
MNCVHVILLLGRLKVLGRIRARLVSGVWVLLLFVALFGVVLNVPLVRASGTIYIRADGSIDPPTAPISTLNNITYTFVDNINDSIVVERNNTIVDGNGYTLQSNGGGNGFRLDSMSNVTIKNTNIKGFSNGVYFGYSSNCSLSGNNITANTYIGIYLNHASNNIIFGNEITAIITYDGIWLSDSSNNSVCQNKLTNNRFGIQIYGSSNNTITGNEITDNSGGIWLRGTSSNRIVRNNITANHQYGIYLSGSLGNIICRNNITANEYGMYYESSDYNSVSENDITSNDQSAVCVWTSSYNRFSHNNFVNNTVMVVYGTTDSNVSGGNVWDEDYPSGGNYWSDYTSVDLCAGLYQNDTGSDGICDEPNVVSTYEKDNITVCNVDRYPLMSPISIFEVGMWNETEYTVDVVSNSSLSHFHFDPDEGAFTSFWVKGETETETTGFCRVAIPKDLLWVEDGWDIYYGSVRIDYSLITDYNCTYLYFTYTNPSLNSFITITINGTHAIPEFPSFLILPLFMTTTLLAILFDKRKRFR